MKVVSSLLKQNIKRIISQNFTGRYVDRTTGLEYEMVCPFCQGGHKREWSFNINVDKAAARCWRATCGYKSSFHSFVAEYFKVEDPKSFIYEGVDEIAIINAEIKGYMEASEKDSFKEAGKIDVWVESDPFDESPFASDVADWITAPRTMGGRGYPNLKKFLRQHSLYIPKQFGFMKGRVCFEVTTKTDRAYLLYAYKDVYPKTINPENAILSRMLYNYNFIDKKAIVLVHEGIFDVARTKSYGFNSVAIFGVHMSYQQAFLLYELEPKEIVLCLDGGTYKEMLDICHKYKDLWRNIKVSIVDLQDIKNDPDNISEDELLGFISDRQLVFDVEPTLEELLNATGLRAD